MGWLALDLPTDHPEFGKIVPCRCTQARIAQVRAQQLRAVSNLGALDRLTFANFLPDGVAMPEAARMFLRRTFEECLAYARDPKGWLVLSGGFGSGKTHLAAAIANHRLSVGQPVVFVVVPDLLDSLRAAFASDTTASIEEMLAQIRDTPLLILDDLGSHNATPWAQEKLFQILNHRYNARLPTVVTTNQSLDELDPRVASRLSDTDLSQQHQIPASDFRGGPVRGPQSLSTLQAHADQTFETFSQRAGELDAEKRANLRQVEAEARQYAQEPRGWLFLKGQFGAGKTHLAAAIANYQVAAGRPAPMFVVVPDLLDHLRATFNPNSGVTLDRLFEQVRNADLLILDDLGTESATPWAREKLFQIFNHRFNSRLPTVITSAHMIEELDPHLQVRIRNSARCRVVSLAVPPYGGEVGGASHLRRGRPVAR
jgi:DNA replication protein DnaC